MNALASGDNYEIRLEGRIAMCRVFQRHDRSSAQGADSAAEIAQHLVLLARREGIDGLVFDFRDAPTVFGPRTEGALGQGFAAFEQARRRVVAVVATQPLQRLQIARVLAQTAPHFGSIEDDLTIATSAAEGRASSPASRRSNA
jgi:hypothetical protein